MQDTGCLDEFANSFISQHSCNQRHVEGIG